MIRGNKLQGYATRCQGDKRPITADVFLTNFCNSRCDYCRYAHTTGDYMRFESFALYADRLLDMGVQGIILTGGGEPTLNPDFEKITGWLERNGVPYGINTNLVKLVKCSPVFLKVSVDAGTSSRYRAIRGVDTFEKVVANIREICAFRRETKSRTNIGVQCVARCQDDVVEFYEAMKGLDVDYIYLRPFEGGKSEVSEEMVKSWLGEIADPRIVFSFKFQLKDYQSPWCIGNWSVITVDWNGNVPYCCHRPNEIVGHILDRNILERKSAYHVDMSLCERPCRLSGANYFLENEVMEKDIAFV